MNENLLMLNEETKEISQEILEKDSMSKDQHSDLNDDKNDS